MSLCSFFIFLLVSSSPFCTLGLVLLASFACGACWGRILSLALGGSFVRRFLLFCAFGVACLATGLKLGFTSLGTPCTLTANTTGRPASLFATLGTLLESRDRPRISRAEDEMSNLPLTLSIVLVDLSISFISAPAVFPCCAHVYGARCTELTVHPSLIDDKPPAPSTPSNSQQLQQRAVFGVPLVESLAVAQIANLPAIVFRSIQYLEAKRADQEEGIYRLSGSSAVIKSLRDRFNAGTSKLSELA